MKKGKGMLEGIRRGREGRRERGEFHSNISREEWQKLLATYPIPLSCSEPYKILCNFQIFLCFALL